MTKHPPPSASNFIINLIGGVSFICAVRLLAYSYPALSNFDISIIATSISLLPIIFCELFFLKVHKRRSVGLTTPSFPDDKRIKTKLLGYLGTLAIIMAFYLLMPHYSTDGFYAVSFSYMLLLLPIYILIGWVYVVEIDKRMVEPLDGLWQAGCFLSGQWENINRHQLLSYAKSILLRAFFLPAMLGYLTINVQFVLDGADDYSQTLLSSLSHSPALALIKFVLVIYFFLAAIDTLFAVIGYIMTFRFMDSHIRSTEPTILGWVVCLLCYYPFWETIMITYLFSEFYNNPEWYVWFNDSPILLAIWGPLAILGMCFESFTTVTFGIRFSNLTYRGLISSGTFRFSKHPQYISKMMNRFFCFVPFLSPLGISGALHSLFLFLCLCFIYYLRAKTEENHLSRYPEYVEYANWINENGIFRWIGKIFPFLIYSEEKAKAGKLF